MKRALIIILTLFSATFMQAGTYVEFKMTGAAGSKNDPGIQGTMKAWYQDGNTRSQMQMEMPGGMGRMPGMPDMGNMIMLLLRDQPDKTFMLDEKNKTYSEIFKNQGKKDQEEDYEITIMGQEKVNGYSTTHIKALSKGPSKAEMEWWVSKEVAGYEEMKNFRSRQFNTSDMYKSMKSKGVDGFPVKMLMGGRGRNREMVMEMNLVKAEKMDMPESRFSLDGYTKREDSPFMPGGMDPEKLKNMSPEERMKFIQEMQKQMGGMMKEAEKGKKEE
jgi:hypothetical protein